MDEIPNGMSALDIGTILTESVSVYTCTHAQTHTIIRGYEFGEGRNLEERKGWE